MRIGIGTSNFVNTECAINYYTKQETDKASVRESITEGLIHIGKPTNSEVWNLTIDSDGRFWKTER